MISEPADFKRRREQRGWSVADAAQRTKLAPRQVEAIEAGEWGELPRGPFVAGAIKLYARALGADASSLVESLDPELARPVAKIENAAAMTQQPPRTAADAAAARNRRMLAAGIALVAIALGLTLFYNPDTPAPVKQPELAAPKAPGDGVVGQAGVTGGSSDAAPAAAPATPVSPSAPSQDPAQPAAPGAAPVAGAAAAVGATPTPAPTPSTGAAPAAAPTDPVAVAQGPNTLRLQFNGDSWVEIKQADGKILLTGLNPKDTVQTLEGTPPFKVKIGNASEVVLQRAGKPVDLVPHIKGAVARLTLE